ncbi:putative reverse transcriptase domain-containing protein [Tanacetum coccineum]
MSSATSAVTYTSVYTDSEPGRAFWEADDEEISEGVPLDEDKREPMFVQAHDPDYVSEPIYPKYIPLEDEHEFPAEEQPLPPRNEEEEAYASLEAWAHAIGLSQALIQVAPDPRDHLYADMRPHLQAHHTATAQADVKAALRETDRRDGQTHAAEETRQPGPEVDSNRAGCIGDADIRTSRLPDPRRWMRLFEVWSKRSYGCKKLRPTQKASDNKRKLMIINNNHGPSNNPPRGIIDNQSDNKGTGERKPYRGSLPKRAMGAAPKGNGCFECGAPGHFRRDCPKLKNKDGGNGNAQGWVCAGGNLEKRGNASRNPDANVVTDHPFNIDLMPVELGSFDVIIGMDWLRRCHAVIVCNEKLVQVPYGNETLTFCGNESSNGRESRLTVISCSKAQEYMAKGCQVFLAQISAKKEEDKSEGKQIKDVPIVRDFPEVFPEDLPGLPPARPVEFQIDLIPGAAPVARAPYRLAPSEMKELSEQLQELSPIKDFIRPSFLHLGDPGPYSSKRRWVQSGCASDYLELN